MKRLFEWSYGVAKKDFPKIKFSSTKLGREDNVSAINKDQYLKAANLLYDKSELEDALLIHIMWSLASRPSEMLTLRFEDFEDINNQKFVYYYVIKKNQRKRFTMSDELYNQVNEFKQFKVNYDKYKERLFTTTTGRLIEGHFVFDLTRSKLQKRFSRKVAKLIPYLKFRPKDVRSSSISNDEIVWYS